MTIVICNLHHKRLPRGLSKLKEIDKRFSQISGIVLTDGLGEV